jgi:uncharacterized protein (TIGR03435 family)
MAFEVASIKPSPPLDQAKLLAGQLHLGMSVTGTRVEFGYTPLMQLICTAYKVKPFQVNGPSWMNSTMFDISAKLPDGATKDQVPEMLQALLADRFKMTLRRENKEHSEYALTVAKGGAKLKSADPERAPADPAAEAQAKPGENTANTPDGPMYVSVGKDGSQHIRGPGTLMTTAMSNGMLHLEATRITMKFLVQLISQFAGTPVIDKTELTGSYKLSLDFSMEELMAMARANGAMTGSSSGGPPPAPGSTPVVAAPEPSSTSIFAMVQQFGLKLAPQKVPEDFLIVDRIEKTPTEN